MGKREDEILKFATLQKETGNIIEISGRVFDISAPENFGKVLSARDKYFFGQVKEFNSLPLVQSQEFVQYLMNAQILYPMPAYGTVAYHTKKGELKTYNSNQGSEAMLFGIQSKVWDPSDVLADLATMCRPLGEKIFSSAREVILKGYNVVMVDDENPRNPFV